MCQSVINSKEMTQSNVHRQELIVCKESSKKMASLKLNFLHRKRLGELEHYTDTASHCKDCCHSFNCTKRKSFLDSLLLPLDAIQSRLKNRTRKIAARKSDILIETKKNSCNVPSDNFTCNKKYSYQSGARKFIERNRSIINRTTVVVQPNSSKVKNKLGGLQVEQGALQRDSSRTFPISAEESDNEELELRTSIAIDNVQPSTTNDHDIHQHVSQSPPHEESVLSCSSSSNNRPTLPATSRPLHHRDFIQEELDFEEKYLNNSDTATRKCNKNDTKSSYVHDCDLPYCKVDRSHPDHYPAFLASASALSPSADHNTKSSPRSRFTRDSYLLHQSYKHQEEHSSHDGLTMSMPRSVRQVIQSLKGNDRCFECGTRKHLSHAFVPLGIVICDECSYDEMEYANEGDILSFEYDFDWRHYEILSVLEGGNDAFRRYLRDNCEGNDEGWVLRDEALYDDVKLSVTALRYRKMLEERVRSVTTALGEQKQQNIGFNTQSLEDEEEECLSSNISRIVKKKGGKRGRFYVRKMFSSRF
ncbi:hypothetical protein CTEN210_01260 [Chaetoceros tenuissimus]|uniref:Arf-GAP domain-containing protein n=1 Tax=Chaetoceros tenuissimus TaxID=426638 RepID=A0AAD3CFC7_9STRA|nr:hypothetical protein CTEN210_01260 [Chaetoceros tenuissimus]